MPFLERSVTLAWEGGVEIVWTFPYKESLLGVQVGFGYEGWKTPAVHGAAFPRFSGKEVGGMTVEFGLWTGF